MEKFICCVNVCVCACNDGGVIGMCAGALYHELRSLAPRGDNPAHGGITNLQSAIPRCARSPFLQPSS